jgi:FixJ family two-component response regulator
MNSKIKHPSAKEENPKYVYLLEDNQQLREDLARTLEFCNFIVFQFSNADDFLNQHSQLVPAVIVTDMRMPGLTGVQLQEKLTTMGRKIPMIFISGESTDAQIVAALKNGAVDFLLKPFSRESLLSAVAKGIEIDSIGMQKLVKKAAFEQKLKILSPRELQVFNLLALGLNNNELMDELKIALPTVKQYKSEVMYKLRLRSVSELIAMKFGSE